MNLGFKASFSKSIGMGDIEQVVVNLLKEEKFGILTEIDVKDVFKKKMDYDIPPYRILGACSPPRARKVLDIDKEIGLLLPCNVLIYENEDSINVSLVNPETMFTLIQSPAVEEVVDDVKEAFLRVFNKLKAHYN